MEDFNFDSLDLGSRRKPTNWVAVAPPMVYRHKINPNKRNNGHRRASKKDGQNSHGKAGAETAGESQVADQITPELLGQSPGSSSNFAESQEAHRTTLKEPETDTSMGTPALPKKKPWSEGTIQARAEEAVKRGPSAATLEWLEAESDEGNVEYKLRLKDPSTMRFQQLVTQMKFRLSEGNGECFYYVGVEDDGYPRGLTPADLEQSLTTLRAMAAEVHAACTLVRSLPGSNDRTCVVVRVHRICRDEVSYTDLRIAVAGAVESGKSTLIAVLTDGARGRPILDNGRGSARMAVFRHKHEIESGHTSSISQHILGFDEDGGVLNYSGVAALTPAEIASSARKVLRFIDMGGHEKYLKTALYAMTSLLPDYMLLCVSARSSGGHLPRSAREHLAVALALEIPLAVVLTQVDVAASSAAEAVIGQLREVLTAAAAGAGVADGLPAKLHATVFLPLVSSEAQAAMLAHEVGGNRSGAAGSVDAPPGLQRRLTVPLFAVSSVTGSGIPLLHAFLSALRPSSFGSAAPSEQGSGEQLSSATQSGNSHASASFYDPDMSKCSDASSVFNVSLDGESCKGPELEAAPRNHQASKEVIRQTGCQESHTHFQVDQTFEVRGVGCVLSGTVVAGRVTLGQQLRLGPDDRGAFKDVTVTCIQREQLPVKMVRAGQHATVATHPVEDASTEQSKPAAQPGARLEVPSHSMPPGQQGAPMDEREVFRIPSPCDGQGTPLLTPQGNQRLIKKLTPPSQSTPIAELQTHLTSQDGAGTGDVQAEGPGQSGVESTLSNSGSQLGGHSISGTLQHRREGGAALMAGSGTGMMEGFGVGSSALEYAQPDEFGGLQIEWAAERSRWALRSNSAPSLVASSAPNSRKGTVLLGMGLQPRAVWRFEAVMVLVSGHWPPRGLLSGCWPPRSTSPTDPDGGSGSDTCSGGSYDASGSRRGAWGRHRPRTSYAPVVHCGSVRQAARVLHMTELCPSSSPDAHALEGCRLAPAVASAAALLCSAPAGGTAPQVMRFGTPDNDIAGCSPPRAHYMPRCDSPASSDEGSPNSLPRTSAWPARLPGSTLEAENDRVEGEVPVCEAPGCVARVTFEFCQRPEWVQEGARLIVHDRTDNCLSGAGIVERLLAGQ
ncbi:g2982 [Coccomyxa elongata]